MTKTQVFRQLPILWVSTQAGRESTHYQVLLSHRHMTALLVPTQKPESDCHRGLRSGGSSRADPMVSFLPRASWTNRSQLSMILWFCSPPSTLGYLEIFRDILFVTRGRVLLTLSKERPGTLWTPCPAQSRPHRRAGSAELGKLQPRPIPLVRN